MRKRLSETNLSKNNPAVEQKRRHKLKSSEILARELECCEKTLNDAKYSYQALKAGNLQAERNYHIQIADFQSLSPIPVDLISSEGVIQKYLAFPMLLDATGATAACSSDYKGISDHPSGLVMGGWDQSAKSNQSSKESFEMQCRQSPELPYPGLPIAEVSQVFVSFLKRLSQQGIVLEPSRTPEVVKNTIFGHHTGTKTGLGPEGLKYGKSAEQVSSKRKEGQREEYSSINYSRGEALTEEARAIERLKAPSSFAMAPQNVAEGWKEASFTLEISQGNAGHTLNEAQLKTLSSLNFGKEINEVSYDEREIQNDSLVEGRSEIVFSEFDTEDKDGLKHLWDTMDFSLACMNETRNSHALEATIQNDECIHEFYKKDDMGLVCSNCGLVGQDAEYIFNYVWGEKSIKMQNRKEMLVENRTMLSMVEGSEELTNLSLHKTVIKILELHPRYKDKLRLHQEEGLRFLEHNLLQDEPSGCILAHAPGTGKSFTMIAFLQSFQTAFPHEKPLIVAPKGMLSVWAREFQKWKVDDIAVLNLQEAKLVEGDDSNENDIYGHQLKRHRQLQMLRQWMAQKSVLMVGYSTFWTLTSDKDAGAFTEIKKLLVEAPGILILDEGHFPRNKKAQITQSLLQVRTKRRVLLSGTLFQNNFDELYNLYHLVKPDFMSSNASCTKALLENFIKAKSILPNGVVTPSKSPRKKSGREAVELDMFRNLGETIRSGEEGEKDHAISLLRHLSQPFVHWYKGEILADLPGLFDLTVYIKMTDKQQQLLSSLPGKGVKQLDIFTKLMRVCIHPVLLKVDYDAVQSSEMQYNDTEEDPRNSSKIMFILDLLQLAVPMKEKVVLFSKYLDPFYLLERILKKIWGWSLNKEILKIEGRTSLEERENTIDRFNEGFKAKVLFASIKTCGEGVSLIGASRIVLLDVHWNPMVSRQAVSRAFRIGQTRKVFVYRLVGAGTKEEDAHLRACEKEWLAKQIFEGCKEGEYGTYCQEVDLLEVDEYFESRHLRENVVKCFRYHFV